jgi:shikimate kinase
LAQIADTATLQACYGMKNRVAPESVALVGFMGAGKTTVGQFLATRLGWRFEDLDDSIAEREGRRIEEIFREQGESYFRGLENRVLRDLLADNKSGGMVLALGGGAFMDAANRGLLEQAGFATVFLDAPAAELFRRCEEPGVVRPLRQELNEFRRLYERRRVEYLKCSAHINSAGKDISAVAAEIIRELNLVTTPGASE